MLFIRPLETYCSYPYVIAVAILVWSNIPIRIWALIRIWAKQEFWPIPVWAGHMHMGQPIRVWAEYLYGTEYCNNDVVVIISTMLGA